MKRILPLLITFFALIVITGCGVHSVTVIDETATLERIEIEDGDAVNTYNEPLRVVATIFPQFDFIRQIAGDRVELSMLLSPGAESHGFEPTPRDVISIYGADLLVYVGGHGDVWVDPILASIGRDDMRTVALIDLVDAVMVDHHHHGHDHGHDHHHHDHDHGHDHHHHDHDHRHDHGHHHHHEPHYDEHVWTCPRNAILIVEELVAVLAELDPSNAYYFNENANTFIAQLQDLDRDFTQVVADGVRSTVVFGDRFPMRYLTDTYGLTYYAAFTGCSAETQASPATIAYLIQKVQEEDIPVVFYIEFSNRLIADVIAEATGARLLEFHSLHNVSPSDFAEGLTYLDLMRRNMGVLREALS